MTVRQDWADWVDDFLHEIRAQMHELNYSEISPRDTARSVLLAAHNAIPLFFQGYLDDELGYFCEHIACAYCEDERTHICYCGTPCCDAHLRHGRCGECAEKADEQVRKVSKR